MANLDQLLIEGRTASKSDRISFRDRIAEHGLAAVPAMQEWLTDPDLGAFAVRVLIKVAEAPSHRRRVLEVLAGVDASTLTSAVARDIDDALPRLGHGSSAASRPSGGAGPPPWSGYASATPLERRFHDAMLDIFRLAGEATRKERPDGTVVRGYWASYFLRGVRNHGGVAYAHQLLRAEGTTDGLKRLTDEHRLDLTMEALVLRPEFAPLFTDAERQVAASRLARAGYEPARTR
jgi:hypothetical protein